MKKNRSNAAFTAVEAIVVFLVVCLLAFLFFGYLQSRSWICDGSPRTNCRESLSQIGNAVYAYTQNYDGYFPFAWQRADAPPPSGYGAANAAMAMTSIGILYPQYVLSARCFICTSANNKPSFIHFPDHGESWPLPDSGWILSGSSYGYDCRVSPRTVENHAIAADMPGNHPKGQNVLYVDGSVRWMTSNFVSNDPADNIYAEDAWNADTDSYIVRIDTGLGKSFDGYPALHYPGGQAR
jgi:prepilin-type processing-associated H-X9-DG protein